MSGPEKPLNAPTPVPVWNPNTPMRAGRVLKAEELTPVERSVLQALGGYDGVSPVPADLGARLEQSVDPQVLAAERERLFLDAARAMPPAPAVVPVGIDIDKVQTKQLDKLPEDFMSTFRAKTEEQQRFRDSLLQRPAPVASPVASTQTLPPVAAVSSTASPNMRDIMERLRTEGIAEADKAGAMDSMHPTIAQAFQQLDQVVAESPVAATASAPAAAAAPQIAPPQAPQDASQPQTREEIIAFRKEKREAEIKRLDEHDLDNYRSAVMLGAPYSKTYTCFDGRVEFTFGDTYGDDYDAVIQQSNIDRFHRRTSDDAEERNEVLRWYLLAVTLRRVRCLSDKPGEPDRTQYEISDSKPLVAQVSADAASMFPGFSMAPGDTAVRLWAEYMRRHVATGSLRPLLLAAMRKFQLHLLTLQYICQDPESF